jgi:hypothetical protein
VADPTNLLVLNVLVSVSVLVSEFVRVPLSPLLVYWTMLLLALLLVWPVLLTL